MKEYPIRDYALIGNCETAALVNPEGGIDWLCLPAFDAPFFGALLDREKGGEFSIRPAHAYRAERRYAGDSAILETRFATGQATVRLTDFFVTARGPGARFYDFTSAPGSPSSARANSTSSANRKPKGFATKSARRPWSTACTSARDGSTWRSIMAAR